MLSVASGYSPDYLLKEVATGRENYYTGAVTDGEPPGRWWGAGAAERGLVGLVDARDMRAVFERFLDPRADGFRDPERWDELAETATLGHTGRKYATEDELYAVALEREPNADAERRAELRTEAGKAARHNVAFLDVTFSVQKSVTLLHTAFEAEEVNARNAGDHETAAAWAAYREAVEDAIWAGNNAALSYLSDKAGYARVGHHGGAAGRYVDAHDWIVASFFQHDSRDHDPQLHIHNPILNRVQGPDGVWRTLDGRSIYRWRAAAAAVAERTTEERIAHAIGLRFATRPDGKAREIVGVDQAAMDLISTRRRAVTAKAAELFDAFEVRFGREPNGAERDRLARQATLATRSAKTHDGETREAVLDRVDAALRAEIAGGLHGVARDALRARDAGEGPEAGERWSPSAVVETALAELQAKKAGWTRADLTRAINAALPDHLDLPEGTDVGELLDTLTDRGLELAVPLDAARPGDDALPDGLRLDNGQSSYDAPGARLYATPDQVKSENVLLAATGSRTGPAAPAHVADRFLEELREAGVELGVDQAAAVRGVLTSGARVETLVGPAGTGKSFVVGTLAKAWADPELRGPEAAGRVFGLATSQAATDVLTGEGLTARNVTRWLQSQERLARHGEALDSDRGWRLYAGDLVVVDESAMTDTAALAAIHRYADAAGAKLLLVGDHRQLAAVGAGGGMDLLAGAGSRYELADARRFTAEWERAASLRLRAGDDTVLREYHRHGRLIDAGTAEEAEASAATAWLADTLAGRRSLLLVDTNDQADRLSASLRAELVRLGVVDEHGAALAGGTFAGVGDVVQARRNGWELIGHEGNRRPPINRETYRVVAVHDDGSLTVTTALRAGEAVDGVELGDRMTLPAGYVATDLALGYASTVYAAQGRTVDTTHVVTTRATGLAALYVALSRGRDGNTAHVTTLTGPDDLADGTRAHQLHRDPVATLAAVLDTGDAVAPRSALASATESSTEAGSARTAAELLADAADLAVIERTARSLDALTADDTLGPVDRARIAAEDGTGSLARLLRRAELAGHDPHEVLRGAVADRPLDGARSVTSVVLGRIRREHELDPAGERWSDWTPRTDDPQWNEYLISLADAADRRAAQLGAELAAAAPRWAIDAFGPVPDDPLAREEWERDAGLVGSYRELRGHEGVDDVLGPAPAPGQVEAYAAYRAAWRALGRPEVDREEAELSDGALRVRVRAYDREATWAPRYVANELAGTHQAAAHSRQTEQLRRAEAHAAVDDDERARLTTEADQAAALAETLEARAGQLSELDDTRARWLVHTAATRAKSDRAKAELAARHIDDVEPEPRVTAEEWLAAHREATIEDERHRAVTETDVPAQELGEPADHVEADQTRDTEPVDDDAEPVEDASAPPEPVAPAPHEEPASKEPTTTKSAVEDEPIVIDEPEPIEEPAPEVPTPDVREEGAEEPAPVAEDVTRVPTADETLDATRRARRALAEMQARDELDAHEAEEQRADELTRWASDDQAAEHEAAALDEGEFADDEPVG